MLSKIIAFFTPIMSEENQRKKVTIIWDAKDDASIQSAFIDATEWIDIVNYERPGWDPCETTIGIAQDCYERLDKYILPQMRKRNLLKKYVAPARNT